MNTVTYVFGIAAAVLALIAIIELMRRTTLRERHAVWWIVGGVLALFVAVFPRTLTWAARLLGIAVPTNLAFFVAIALLFLVSLQYGAELTRIEDKLRVLAEHTAFLDDRCGVLRHRQGTVRGSRKTIRRPLPMPRRSLATRGRRSRDLTADTHRFPAVRPRV